MEMTMKQVFTKEFAGRSLVVEYGELGKQADAAVLVRFADTVSFSVAQGSTKPTSLGFFPLLVLYNEKMYAAGKIPGGFFKREGRPSTNETLTARLIDRTLRPLFPDGYKNEVQVINTIMSSNEDHSPEMTALFGSSLALSISPIPFHTPVAGVLVGRVNGEFIINPTKAQLEASDIDLIVSGTIDAINMVEAGAKQVTEADMIDAIMFGHEAIKDLIGFILDIKQAVGKDTASYEVFVADPATVAMVESTYKARIVDAIQIAEKLARQEALDAIKDELVASLGDEPDSHIKESAVSKYDSIVKQEVRRLIAKEKVRPDGRKATELRPLDSQIDILPRTHGSALFTRGQTQALSITTLGALGDYQLIDGLNEEIEMKRFMHHYNFPAYSVGEVGRYMAPGRREIGHGMLGERALQMVMPDEEEFPYTVRVVSEILESNGSTSQASICASTMSLMAAGVPIKAPVAGIAMGLIEDGDDYTVLTDIQGMEDHLGDMDFKVAGTAQGITALQMDIKIAGLSRQILEEALEQAKIGRLQILDNMLQAIASPRPEVSEYAPKVMIMHIKPEQIRDVIGSGGKIITDIIEKSGGVKIDIEQDGKVVIMHTTMEPIRKAMAMIENLTREVEIGAIYPGVVKRVEKFGCFVEIWPGQEGLVHVSKLAHERVENVEDVVKVGDQINVKAIKVDEKGRLDLSRKDAMPRPVPQPKNE
jgi:polyribonucleotide nucleotidyltransferase